MILIIYIVVLGVAMYPRDGKNYHQLFEILPINDYIELKRWEKHIYL